MLKKNGLALILALLLVVAVTAAGCDKKDNVNSEEIYSQFSAIADKGPTSQGILETTEFLNANIGKLDVEDASYMVLAYEDYLARFINSDADKALVQQLVVYYDKEQQKVDESRIQDEGLRELLDSLQEGNLTFSLKGTGYTLSIDYTALAAEYETYILEALYDLYLMKGRGTENPVMENAALLVDFSQLAERAYEIELLIQEHKEEPLIREDVLYWYNYYNSFLLLGANNTPVFDYQDGKFSQEAKRAYEMFVQEHPESATAWLLGEYLAYVEESGYVRDYSDAEQSQAFLAQCSLLTAEAEKRVYQ